MQAFKELISGRLALATAAVLFIALVQSSLPDEGDRAHAEPAKGSKPSGVMLKVSAMTQGKFVQGFDIELCNDGDHDITANLGMSVANNKILEPEAVSLIVTDQAGGSRKLNFASKLPGIAGRIDDYLVPIRHRGAYRLHLDVDNFSTADFQPVEKLKLGKCSIRAVLNSQKVRYANGDSDAALIDLWIGQVESDSISVEFLDSQSTR